MVTTLLLKQLIRFYSDWKGVESMFGGMVQVTSAKSVGQKLGNKIIA